VIATASARAIILDRDGTIVVDGDYLDEPARLQFLPGAAEGLRRLHERGHPLIVVSNQSGVGRGLFSLARLQEINERFLRMVEEAGAKIDGLYFCPHRPEDNCACRKPGIQLVLDAAAALGFVPARSVVIGDKGSDVELGRRLQALTMLVSATGRASDGQGPAPDYVVHDLREAAAIIEKLERSAAPSGRDTAQA
jgi:D-glycero-D-manno-heptose 1,7-bisphosphate phosphatase